MNNYEIMFIVKTTIEADEVKNTVEKFKKLLTDRKAKIDGVKELGQKKLAYPIKKEINGFYFVMNLSANNEAIAEFNRVAAIDENIIRHLIINLDKE